MERFVGRIGALDLSAYTNEMLLIGFLMRPEDNLRWLSFLYERREWFALLIKCAAGSRYAFFHRDWADRMNRLDYKFYRKAYARGMATRVLSMEEMYGFTSAIWAMFYEPYIHGFGWEQLERHETLIFQSINWHELPGITEPN